MELISCVNFIVDNSYIVFHNEIYRQIVGVPMGTNCAPFLANLFLHIYEYEYLEKLINNGQIEVAKALCTYVTLSVIKMIVCPLMIMSVLKNII